MAYYPAPSGGVPTYQKLSADPQPVTAQPFYPQGQPAYVQPAYTGPAVPTATVVYVSGGGGASASSLSLAGARRLFVASALAQLLTIILLAASMGTSWLVITLSLGPVSSAYSMDVFYNVRICTTQQGGSSCTTDNLNNLGTYGFSNVGALASGSRAAAILAVVSTIFTVVSLLHAFWTLRTLRVAAEDGIVRQWLVRHTLYWRHPGRRMGVVAFEMILAVALYNAIAVQPFLKSNNIPSSIPDLQISQTGDLGPGFGLACATIATSVLAALLSGCAIARLRKGYAESTARATWVISTIS